uniref:Palm2 and akap2 fusion n=1 Tax=Neogobius melanostomus TaxID=47308 RepID=A0A8C6SKX4_9GOBI
MYSDVVQEICYLDQVLDAASEAPTNGDASEHHKTTRTDGVPSAVVTAEGHVPTAFTHEEHSPIHTNGHAQDDYSQSKPKFELRSFYEEKKPAKLFSPGDEQPVRVTRRRPTEEVQELERERQELIKDQAVRKNPGIAQRWWNPPQEVPLEEQLDAEQLESLKKYQERKQQKQTHTYTYTQLTRKDDIVEEQIDFSSARKQFLQDNKKDVAPQIYSAKPFSKSRASSGNSDIIAESGESHVTWSDEGIGGDFTCARAVMTILREDEETKAHFQSSFPPEESDSGLDELSVRSQDTTIYSLDNVSDSGASLPPTPQPLTPVSPPTPQPTTPINGQNGGSLTEDDLEYHAGVLVENAIQNALAAQTGNDWQPSFSDSSAPASPPATKHPDVKIQEKPLEKLQTPSPPPSQPVSPHQPTPVYRPPSPPSADKPEFSYFSKYSEAAELRSTATSAKGPEVEPASGPFRLRSKKQRTLSMIEEEIRAAQEREEELKKQRENKKTTITPADKMKSNSLPTRLTLTAKTAPGKIEKVRPAPPVSPSPSEGALSDAGSEDSSGSSRPKNFMQTLMEDYETHKVKKREKMEDSQVLEATRVTRRKSGMALRWEAGIYNEDGPEEEGGGGGGGGGGGRGVKCFWFIDHF